MFTGHLRLKLTDICKNVAGLYEIEILFCSFLNTSLICLEIWDTCQHL